MVHKELNSERKSSPQSQSKIDIHSRLDDKAEVGILIVHGIGEQKQGQTLVTYGDPLLRFMHHWMDGAKQASIRKKDSSSASAQAVQYYEMRADGAVLNGGTRRDDTPPHVLIKISGPPGTDPARWIVAEAFWADSFPEPHPVTVSHWLMRIGPWVWISFFARRLRQGVLSMRRTKPDAGFRFWPKVCYETCKVLGLLIVTLLLSPAVLLLELILLVLLIAGLIPLPAIRNVIKQIHAKISGVLGDSFMFDSSIIGRQAVLKRIIDDLKWLERRSHNVVILGHSQGGALSYLTLKEYPSTQVKLLVTVGSGLLKLHLIEKQRLQVDVVAYQSIMTATFFLFTCVELFHFLSVPAKASYLIWVHCGMVVCFFAMSVGLAMREETEELREWAKEQSSTGLHWADLFASLDPVPNGPLFLHPEAGIESIEVRNEGFLFRSHTTYSSNVDEFYAHLTNLIGKYGGTRVPLGQMTPWDEQARVQARLARRTRLFTNKVDRGALLLALMVALLNGPLLTQAGKAVWGVGESACRMLSSVSRSPESGPCWKLSPIMSGVVALLICWVVLGWIVKFFSFLTASMAEGALYERLRWTVPQVALIGWFSHLFSFVPLLMALQSHSTKVFPLVKTIADLIPYRRPESLLFWQPCLLGITLALTISVLEMLTLAWTLRELWTEPDSFSAGAEN